MAHIFTFLFSLAFWVAVTFSVMAQEIKPLGEPQHSTSKTTPPELKRVEELKALQRQIILAEHQDKRVEREQLYKILKTAESEEGGRFVADAIWRNWFASAPSPEITKLIESALERRRWYDYEGALEFLDKAAEQAPDYSETWNQRAYILFLQEKFDESLQDIDKALKLEPRHFGALSGKARILFHQGHHERAQKALKQAVNIHPWIYERFLLTQPPASGQEPAEIKTGTKL